MRLGKLKYTMAAIIASTVITGTVLPAVTASSAFAEAVSVQAPNIPGFADVVEAVSPAVVSVKVKTGIKPVADSDERGGFRFDRRKFGDHFPFFKEFGERGKKYFEFGPNGRRGENDRRQNRRHKRRFSRSQGSGFFISDDGFIVTNHHVIEKGDEISVILNDGTELEAKLVGSDKRSDLALLKVDSDKKFTYVEFADKRPRIGDWVVAVGNPYGLGGTVTSGIVSAHGREINVNRYDDFLQIDAAVNRGNSGGPTFNLEGKVVGVNTAIFSPSGGNIGIAFAIPASTASDIVESLMENGQVSRGWLGVQIQPVSKDIAESVGLEKAHGAIVSEAQVDSPAKKAGIRAGDIITHVNNETVKGPRQLARKIGQNKPNANVVVKVWRNGEAKDITVKLGSLTGKTANLMEQKSEKPKSLARLGLELAPSEDGNGVRVTDVVPGSGADERGIKVGDKIVSINGETITEPSQVLEVIQKARKMKRKAALVQIEREGNNRFIAVPFKRG